MSGVLKIEVMESPELLYQKLQSTSNAAQRSKLQVLWWLKTGKVKTVNALAEWSGHHRITISRWLSQYRQQGLEAMLELKHRSGRPSVMPEAVKDKLMKELAKGHLEK